MARTEIAARLDGAELVNDFKAARNKREQVNILADLNCVAPRVIAELLHELGALEGTGLRVKEFSAHYVPVPPARTRGSKEPKCENTHQVGRPRKAWDLDLIRRCYDQGMSDESIACEAGCSRGTVCNWRKRNGLPPVPQKKTGGAEDMAKFKLRETEEAAIEREEEQERKFEAIIESVDAGKQQPLAKDIDASDNAAGGWDGLSRYPMVGTGSGRGPIVLTVKCGTPPKALTVGDFLDAARKYLTEATADAPLSINGEPVRGFGVEIAVRAEQVYVDVRTREASA